MISSKCQARAILLLTVLSQAFATQTLLQHLLDYPEPLLLDDAKSVRIAREWEMSKRPGKHGPSKTKTQQFLQYDDDDDEYVDQQNINDEIIDQQHINDEIVDQQTNYHPQTNDYKTQVQTAPPIIKPVHHPEPDFDCPNNVPMYKVGDKCLPLGFQNPKGQAPLVVEPEKEPEGSSPVQIPGYFEQLQGGGYYNHDYVGFKNENPGQGTGGFVETGGPNVDYDQGHIKEEQGTVETGFEQGTANGGNEQSTGNGGYEQGTGNGGYEQGTGNGGYEQGTGNGGYEQGTRNGGYEQGTGNGGYEQGTGNGGYEQGTGNGGYEQGTGNGGYEQGTRNEGYEQGTGNEGYEQQLHKVSEDYEQENTHGQTVVQGPSHGQTVVQGPSHGQTVVQGPSHGQSTLDYEVIDEDGPQTPYRPETVRPVHPVHPIDQINNQHQLNGQTTGQQTEQEFVDYPVINGDEDKDETTGQQQYGTGFDSQQTTGQQQYGTDGFDSQQHGSQSEQTSQGSSNSNIHFEQATGSNYGSQQGSSNKWPWPPKKPQRYDARPQIPLYLQQPTKGSSRPRRYEGLSFRPGKPQSPNSGNREVGFKPSYYPPPPPKQIDREDWNFNGVIESPVYDDLPANPEGFSCFQKKEGYYVDYHSGCKRFYVCAKGHFQAYEFACPLGTKFNDKIEACDYEDSVVCSQKVHYG